jgi:HlyD family secretion protein
MNEEQLQKLRIASERKRRSSISLWVIGGVVLAVTAVVAVLAIPRAADSDRAGLKSGRGSAPAEPSAGSGANSSVGSNSLASLDRSGAGAGRGGLAEGSLLRVSGYIVNRERIELSPRFIGVVKWIGVKRGDVVTNGQVVVLLDDSEYQARLAESEGRLAVARVGIEKAKLDLKRAGELVSRQVEMQKILDDARLELATAEAQVQEIEGSMKVIRTWLDWCTIRSPVDGVVLERLVDPNELVTPQTFGGTRGPSTSLLAVADPTDLQVEIDLNEADLAKVSLNQKCRVSPEAYPDKAFDGFVAEIAPEASRQKGTLQVRVQIQKPNRYLTPELSARVDFLESKP